MHISLEELDIYKIARELSSLGWEIFNFLDRQTKIMLGEQFIRSVDSIGANIAEGYGRYHYLDRIKFIYKSRASLYEYYKHWLELLYERKKISEDVYKEFRNLSEKLLLKLNNFINSLRKNKK